MRILIVTQYFWPENFRINDLAVELVKRGHQVTVLTGKPNYPEGKLFSVFKTDPDSFRHFNGVDVFRVPMSLRGKGKLSLFLNYISYPLSASTFGLWNLRNKEFDVIFICQLSPILLALPGIVYKKIYGKPVVMWVLDLWPDSLESVGVINSKRILAFIGGFVRYIYNRCDLVLGQSKAFYDGIAKYCDNKEKIRYFPSWSESVFVDNNSSFVNELIKTNSFKVLFAGNVGEAQDFPAILSAAELIKALKQGIKFFVVGDGRAFEDLKIQVVNRGLEDVVILLGRYPLEDMPSFYSAADALMVTLKESKAFSMTIPGKLQSYMAAGKPVLTMLSGEGSRIVKDADCGLVAMSGDYEAFSENIIAMSRYSKEELEKLGQNAKRYADEEFSREKLISQLENWFEEVKKE